MPEFDSSLEFRPIPGFPAYRIGNNGSVWSCWKRVSRGYNKGAKCILGDTWRQLIPHVCTTGHLRVWMGGKDYLLHRLVLEAFVGPCPDGMQCRHFPDRNPANNALSNLAWGTAKENQADRVIHGTSSRGPQGGKARLTEESVHEIRRLSKTMTQRVIAKTFGVSLSAVSFILTGRNWKYLTPQPQTTS